MTKKLEYQILQSGEKVTTQDYVIYFYTRTPALASRLTAEVAVWENDDIDEFRDWFWWLQ